MSSLHADVNVYSSCIAILKAKGYAISIVDNKSERCINWLATKGDYVFSAYNPLELLGLVAIYEFKSPDTPPFPYWWVVEPASD
jgi:hypothetical protein